MSSSIVNYTWKCVRACIIGIDDCLNIIIESCQLISTELKVRVQHKLQWNFIHDFVFQLIESIQHCVYLLFKAENLIYVCCEIFERVKVVWQLYSAESCFLARQHFIMEEGNRRVKQFVQMHIDLLLELSAT